MTSDDEIEPFPSPKKSRRREAGKDSALFKQSLQRKRRKVHPDPSVIVAAPSPHSSLPFCPSSPSLKKRKKYNFRSLFSEADNNPLSPLAPFSKTREPLSLFILDHKPRGESPQISQPSPPPEPSAKEKEDGSSTEEEEEEKEEGERKEKTDSDDHKLSPSLSPPIRDKSREKCGGKQKIGKRPSEAFVVRSFSSPPPPPSSSYPLLPYFSHTGINASSFLIPKSERVKTIKMHFRDGIHQPDVDLPKIVEPRRLEKESETSWKKLAPKSSWRHSSPSILLSAEPPPSPSPSPPQHNCISKGEDGEQFDPIDMEGEEERRLLSSPHEKIEEFSPVAATFSAKVGNHDRIERDLNAHISPLSSELSSASPLSFSAESFS